MRAPMKDMRPILKVSVKASHSDNIAQQTNTIVAYNGIEVENNPIKLKIGSKMAVNPNKANVKFAFEC